MFGLSLFKSLFYFALALITAARPQDGFSTDSWSGGGDGRGGSGVNNGKVDIKAELGPQLSRGATILLPQDGDFTDETERWSLYSAPTFRAVVEVTSEQDVQATMRWANKYQIPYLPVGGHHGINSALGTMRNGIEISFSRMKSIDVSRDGRSANVGVGLHSGELVRGLFAKGKRTTTGACLCTGVMGPLLGGGHGLLQGQHGLLTDQLIEARMVLADGSAITVSDSSNRDLFWAIRGAGHNFGVVTSIKLKVYDQPQRDWTYLSIAYPGVMVQQVFQASNEFNKNVPAEITNYIVMRRIPGIDPNNTIILSNFFYDGSPEQLARYTAPFAKVPQMFNSTKIGNYVDIYALGVNDEKSPQCQPGSYKNVFGVELNTYDPATEKKVYDMFNTATADPRFVGGNIIFESYGRQAVLAVPDDSTAVPFRKFAVDVTPQMIYGDASLADQGVAKGKQIRDLIQSQTGSRNLNTYVNYAFGDESLQATYGYEPWRLEKLRRLKRQYEPMGKFNYFAPITY